MFLILSFFLLSRLWDVVWHWHSCYFWNYYGNGKRMRRYTRTHKQKHTISLYFSSTFILFRIVDKHLRPCNYAKSNWRFFLFQMRIFGMSSFPLFCEFYFSAYILPSTAATAISDSGSEKKREREILQLRNHQHKFYNNNVPTAANTSFRFYYDFQNKNANDTRSLDSDGDFPGKMSSRQNGQ